MTECFDLLGVGFGPANLSLAVALEEESPETSALFLEAQRDPVWQRGMLLEGSNIQNHPSRDLVTLRNPRSRYSFLNYLHEHGRLVEHLNVPVEFPLRKEYAHYLQWVTTQHRHWARFGTRVSEITTTEVDGKPAYRVTCTDGVAYKGRALVVGTGRTPFVPPPFDRLCSPRVTHLVGYLQTLEKLTAAPESVAVIGASQSAVEIMLDLQRRFPKARLVDYLRTFGFRLKDTSPFSEEGFFPEFTNYYHAAPRQQKHMLDAYLRSTNYSSVDDDVLHRLYELIYEQRLDGDQRVFTQRNTAVRAAHVDEHGVHLDLEEVITGARQHDRVDLVVLATGFRDLGPGPAQEAVPPLLKGLADRLLFDSEGYLKVDLDYALRSVGGTLPPLVLNGLCESTHGIGDAGSFSLLSLRAMAILNGLRCRGVLAPQGAPGESEVRP